MPEGPSQPAAEPRRVEIVVSGATVLKAAFVALGVFVLIVANEVFLTILLSLVFALGLDPLVGWFTARELMASRRERMEALRASRASPT